MTTQPSQPSNPPVAPMRGGMHRGPGMPGRIEKAKNPRNTLLRLAPFFAPFKARLAVVLFFVVGYSLLGLAGPYLMGVAIDQYITTKQIDGLARIALLMLAAFVIVNLFTFFQAG